MTSQTDGVRIVDLSLDQKRELAYLVKRLESTVISGGVLRMKLRGCEKN